MEFHQARQATVTLGLVQVPDTRRYGAVRVDAQGWVQAFAEKSAGEPGLINGGVYVFNSSLLAQFGLEETSLEREVFPRLAGRGLLGMCMEGFFADIGTPETYQQLQASAEGFLKSLYG